MSVPVERLAFPYKRTAPEGFCELCHEAADVLSPITVDEPRWIEVQTNSGKVRRWRMRRVIFACSRHAGGNGPPIVAPNTRMLRGTSRLHPQRECLFDDLTYKRLSVACREPIAS